MELLTHSRLSTFRACPKRAQFRYELGWTPEEEPFALRVGTAFHAALEARDHGHDIEAAIHARGDLDPFDAALVAAMFTTYCERWPVDTFEVLSTELPFERALLNPETGSPSKVWAHAGKIDKIVRLPDGRTALVEHKTSSEDLAPGSDYWLTRRLDSQISLYVVAARELGYDVSTVLFDVTKRPAQRPFKATPPDKIKLKKDGTPYADTRLADETPEEFAARVADAMRADPERYFVRHEIARLDQDLADAQADLWSLQLAVREAQRSGRWWRNPAACLNPIRCAYANVCATRDLTNVPAGFRRLADVHPELARSEQAEPAREGQASHSNGV